MVRARAGRGHTAWLNTIGLAVQSVWIIGLIYLLLSFPSGRLQGRLDRRLVAIGVVGQSRLQLLAMLYGNKAGLRCPGCANNLLQIGHDNHQALAWIGLQHLVGEPADRDRDRVAAPALAASERGAAASRRAGAGGGMRDARGARRRRSCFDLVGDPLGALPANVYFTLMATVPVAVMFVFLQRRLARGMVAGLVVELGAAERGGRSARSAGPGARRPVAGARLLVPGRALLRRRRRRTPVKLPDARQRRGARRSSSATDSRSRRCCTIRCSSTTPGSSRSVCAAASLALENERLQAELRARLVELQASRARLVEATDAERRRIERDLHDGTQQRLVSIAMSLGLLETRLPEEAAAAQTARPRDPPSARARARGAARADPRDQSPAADRARAAGGARRALPPRRAADPAGAGARWAPPDQIESAAYFMASEALTNAAKHSHGSEIRVVATADAEAPDRSRSPTTASAAPRPRGGSGLRGLADRIEALGGRFTVSSPPGRGTTLRAEIPCA